MHDIVLYTKIISCVSSFFYKFAYTRTYIHVCTNLYDFAKTFNLFVTNPSKWKYTSTPFSFFLFLVHEFNIHLSLLLITNQHCSQSYVHFFSLFIFSFLWLVAFFIIFFFLYYLLGVKRYEP